jgi:hypothetical protein
VTNEAPHQLPEDHLDVRDLSYDFTRTRQMYDLFKQSLFDPGSTSPQAPTSLVTGSSCT